MGLLKVFYSPEEVFAEEGKAGKWLVPFLVLLLLSALTSAVFVNIVDMGAVTRAQFEQNPKWAEKMGQDKVDQAVRDANGMGAKIRTVVFATIASALGVLVLAGILFGLGAMTGAEASFKNILTICAYSAFAYGLLTGVGNLVVIKLMSDPSSLDVYNIIKLNPTLFMDQATASKPLYTFAASLDLLSVWYIFLLGLGISKVSVRTSIGKGVGLVLVPWVIWVLLKVGVAVLASAMMGA